MSRPVAWSSKKLISQAPAATPAEVSLPPKEKPPSAGRPTARAEIAAVPRDIALPESSSRGEFRTPEFAAPGFSFSGQEPSRSNRKFVMIGGSSLAALVVVGVVALNLTQDPAGAKGSAPIAREPGAALAVKWTPVSESPRRISVLRDSTSLKDFRMTFQSPVSQKAIGWVFRARDSKNYYAMRLDLPRSVSGSSYAVGTSTGVLKRFAVIDGLDQPATQIPVTIAVQPGATYKIRTEAVGSRFTTWIADRQVDEWAEERLGDGAVGLYNEHGEPPTVVGDLAVSPLVRKR